MSEKYQIRNVATSVIQQASIHRFRMFECRTKTINIPGIANNRRNTATNILGISPITGR